MCAVHLLQAAKSMLRLGVHALILRIISTFMHPHFLLTSQIVASLLRRVTKFPVGHFKDPIPEAAKGQVVQLRIVARMSRVAGISTYQPSASPLTSSQTPTGSVLAPAMLPHAVENPLVRILRATSHARHLCGLHMRQLVGTIALPHFAVNLLTLAMMSTQVLFVRRPASLRSPEGISAGQIATSLLVVSSIGALTPSGIVQLIASHLRRSTIIGNASLANARPKFAANL